MAVFANSTPASAFQSRRLLRGGGITPCAVLTTNDVLALMADAPDLPAPFVFPSMPSVDDPRTAVELLDEIRSPIEAQEAEAIAARPELPAPASLPSLTSAFSRRRAIFGCLALAAAPVTTLPLLAAPTLSANDARLVALADAYDALERRCEEHGAAHRGRGTKASDAEFDALASGFQPIEDEMAETPADSMAGVLAKARTCQSRTLRGCAEFVSLSVADDVWRLFGGGAHA